MKTLLLNLFVVAHLDTTTIFGLFEARRVRARGLHRVFSLVGRLPSAGVVLVSRFALLVAAALTSIAPTGCASGEKPPCCRKAEPTGAYTDKSLYQLDSNWISDVSKDIKLGVFQGRPQVLAMFFASCEYACPIIVHDMKRIQEALPPALRHKVNFTLVNFTLVNFTLVNFTLVSFTLVNFTLVSFTLVSFDTERDTPAALLAYRQRQNLGTDHWSLLAGKPDDVRELAALLGVNYQKDARGQFAHSNVITVLNPAGEIVHQQIGLNQDIFATVKAIERASEPTKSKPHLTHE